MRQTDQQEQGAAPAKPRARKDWEWFWRITAGLMMILIAWIGWVVFQITPRSVVTPLAYELRDKQQTTAGSIAAGASPPPVLSAPPVLPEAAGLPGSQGAAEAAVADPAQAAARAGGHQSSADVRAAALATGQEKAAEERQPTREGLKLSTELGTPPAEKK